MVLIGCVRSEHDCDHVVMTPAAYQGALRRIYLVGLIVGAAMAVSIWMIWTSF